MTVCASGQRVSQSDHHPQSNNFSSHWQLLSALFGQVGHPWLRPPSGLMPADCRCTMPEQPTQCAFQPESRPAHNRLILQQNATHHSTRHVPHPHAALAVLCDRDRNTHMCGCAPLQLPHRPRTRHRHPMNAMHPAPCGSCLPSGRRAVFPCISDTRTSRPVVYSAIAPCNHTSNEDENPLASLPSPSSTRYISLASTISLDKHKITIHLSSTPSSTTAYRSSTHTNATYRRLTTPSSYTPPPLSPRHSLLHSGPVPHFKVHDRPIRRRRLAF